MNEAIETGEGWKPTRCPACRSAWVRSMVDWFMSPDACPDGRLYNVRKLCPPPDPDDYLDWKCGDCEHEWNERPIVGGSDD